MTEQHNTVEIKSRNYWFKVVEFLQTNWALIDERENGTAHVWFLNDVSGVFDEMDFPSLGDAVDGLMRNGFDLYDKAEQVHKFLAPPNSEFKREPHPNGNIYSSGRFWKS